ncbi:ATP-binding protein [Streptomyces palmae]|uniref:ATP-binding protein n=1 Tax=Streptomyces palmae TaxID=1701085 RepID=A0A4Z0HDH0_9ACTN|nr:ATP-binding protein [Streptomyces palmae]TGB14961.1 ATP-binding protein [Streptomyces palmae]
MKVATLSLDCLLERAVTVGVKVTPRGEHGTIPEQDGRRISQMRQLAKTLVNCCGLTELADDVELVVSELVTNAIQHSRGTRITMGLQLVGPTLRVVVVHGTQERPRLQRTDDSCEHGRGLFLVKSITAEHNGSWGTTCDGTATWCEFSARRPEGTSR